MSPFNGIAVFTGASTGSRSRLEKEQAGHDRPAYTSVKSIAAVKLDHDAAPLVDGV
jgi:hypothetical protein